MWAKTDREKFKEALARDIFLMRLAQLPPGGSLQDHHGQIDHEAELATYAATSLTISLEHREEKIDAE